MHGLVFLIISHVPYNFIHVFDSSDMTIKNIDICVL